MHRGLSNDYSPRFLPLLHTPRGPLQVILEVHLTTQPPLVPLHMHLILDRNRHPIQRPQRLTLLVPLRRGFRGRANSLHLRLEKRNGVFTGWLRIATHQGQQRLHDIHRRQFPSLIQRMVIRRRVVILLSQSRRRRWQFPLIFVFCGVLVGNHSWIVSSGILLQLRNSVNDV